MRIVDAIAMAGIESGWKKVAAEMGEKAEDMKHRLDSIVGRRNVIVHEGDHERGDRPRTIKHEPIDPGAVLDDLDWLGQLIETIGKVAGP